MKGDKAKQRSTASPDDDSQEESKMGKPLAWLIMVFFVSLTGVLLWFGCQIEFRTERIAPGRLDVIMQRKLFALIPLDTEVVADVVSTSRFLEKGVSEVDGKARRTISDRHLVLTCRDGSTWVSPARNSAFGSDPKIMAFLINDRLLNPSSTTPIVLWWFPLVVNILAIPFLLVSGFLIVAMGEVLLRALGFFRPDVRET